MNSMQDSVTLFTDFEPSEPLEVTLEIKTISNPQKPFLQRFFDRIFDTKWKKSQRWMEYGNDWKIKEFWERESNYDIGLLEFDYVSYTFEYLIKSELERQEGSQF